MKFAQISQVFVCIQPPHAALPLNPIVAFPCMAPSASYHTGTQLASIVGSHNASGLATRLLRVTTPLGYKYHALRLLGALRWVTQQQLEYTYLLKTDDDAYICPSSLLARLRQSPRSRLYFGKMIVGRQANRTASSQWHDPRYARVFPGHNGLYATYAAGSLYVLSSDLAARVDAAATSLALQPGNVPAFEDAMVGALLASSKELALAVRVVDVAGAIREYPSAHWILDVRQFRALKRRRENEENDRACRSRRYLALHSLPAPALRQCALLAGPRCS